MSTSTASATPITSDLDVSAFDSSIVTRVNTTPIWFMYSWDIRFISVLLSMRAQVSTLWIATLHFGDAHVYRTLTASNEILLTLAAYCAFGFRRMPCLCKLSSGIPFDSSLMSAEEYPSISQIVSPWTDWLRIIFNTCSGSIASCSTSMILLILLSTALVFMLLLQSEFGPVIAWCWEVIVFPSSLISEETHPYRLLLRLLVSYYHCQHRCHTFHISLSVSDASAGLPSSGSSYHHLT